MCHRFGAVQEGLLTLTVISACLHYVDFFKGMIRWFDSRKRYTIFYLMNPNFSSFVKQERTRITLTDMAIRNDHDHETFLLRVTSLLFQIYHHEGNNNNIRYKLREINK